MKKLLTLLFFVPVSLGAQIITTVAGNGNSGYSGDGGAATSAQMGLVPGVALDANGNIYITDYGHNNIRKVSGSGVISTIIGTTAGYSGDGGQATLAKIYKPSAIMITATGDIIFSDCDNHVVRKVDPSGIITTIAGNHVQGYSGDGGPATAAQLNFPEGLALDAAGDLYIADFDNNRVRKIDPSGIITTVVGTGVPGYSGDGGSASAAKLQRPYGIALSNGDMYVSDYFNHVIRKVNASGIITTIAGTGVAGYSGDGGPATSAQFNLPKGIAFDLAGNLLVAEFNNHTVRKIDPSGLIYTVAGDHTIGYSGDGGPATSAQLNAPETITVDLDNNIFIADHSNNVVRKIQCTPTKPVVTISAPFAAFESTQVTVTATVVNAGSSYLIHWMNHGIQFNTTTVPYVTYTKTLGIDTITARVVSTASFGCYDSTTSDRQVVMVGEAVGGAVTASYSIYPNPIGNTLHLDGLTKSSTYRIVNMIGATQQQGTLRPGQNSIPVQTVPPGMYMLEVITDGQRTVNRVMKQ